MQQKQLPIQHAFHAAAIAVAAEATASATTLTSPAASAATETVATASLSAATLGGVPQTAVTAKTASYLVQHIWSIGSTYDDDGAPAAAA